MQKYAVILAGGEGRRAGGDMPKQFRSVAGRPVVWWSMKAFLDEDPLTRVVLVMHPGFFDDWNLMLAALPEADRLPHILCCGGRDRSDSVENGLQSVAEDAGWPQWEDMADDDTADDAGAIFVAIHDGARPLVTPAMIRRGWEACRPGVCAVPAVSCTDSLRRYADPGQRDLPLGERRSQSVDRADFVAVRTPQVFTAADIARAHLQGDGSLFTDDASLAEAAGIRASLYEGDSKNIKITWPEDFRIAEITLF